MLSFFTASENLPFAVALTLMLGIAILEGITTILGAGVSSVIESFLPDAEFDINVDSADAGSPSALSRLLGWLRVGQVPVLMLLVIFLTAFGLSGFILQSTFLNLSGHMFTSWIASIPAFILSIPVVRVMGGFLHRFMPQDESESVSSDSFIGRIATITLGTASAGSPAQAKLKDEFGHTHYIMVEPDLQSEMFIQQEQVLVVKKQGSVFTAIKNSNQTLIQ
ncbi:MAG: YqiJ family protein [Gammaproteobacteria bacterium]|nr:YqiJ family protein [Gammaproteobacteria bacterium]MDH5728113.1 YqiJ family protein [Gammaproteobacteria bacterium]